MRKPIDEETKQKAIRLYKNKDMSVPEIANLLGVHIATLSKIYRDAFGNGSLTPRRPKVAMTPRTPNGQGKDRKPTGRKKGNPHWGENKKFDADMELKIAIDYYHNDLSTDELKAKYNCHPMQLQAIRNKYRDRFGEKKFGRKRKVKNEKVCNI